MEKHLKLVKQAWWWFHAGCYQLKHWQTLQWSVITLENVSFSRCLNISTQWEILKMLPDGPDHLKMFLKLNTIILPITRQGHTILSLDVACHWLLGWPSAWLDIAVLTLQLFSLEKIVLNQGWHLIPYKFQERILENTCFLLPVRGIVYPKESFLWEFFLCCLIILLNEGEAFNYWYSIKVMPVQFVFCCYPGKTVTQFSFPYKSPVPLTSVFSGEFSFSPVESGMWDVPAISWDAKHFHSHRVVVAVKTQSWWKRKRSFSVPRCSFSPQHFPLGSLLYLGWFLLCPGAPETSLQSPARVRLPGCCWFFKFCGYFMIVWLVDFTEIKIQTWLRVKAI